MHRFYALALLLTALCPCTQKLLSAQQAGQYTNPVLFADYSDPDVIRDGKDFYLVASTFHFSPGIPILHSTDLVHWTLLGHAVSRLNMDPAYDMSGSMRYGGGIWAPAVRFHGGLFYIYFPTPDEGIFVITAPSMKGPWTAPEAVLPGPGYEDPCPFWDDDGKAYLVHSRKGAGPLILHRMSADGKHLLDAGKVIVQDPVHLHTLEGPKLYKRNGWYYIFAPFGGVSTGAQAVLRSRSIDGPYEYRTVLAQGDTAVNGPHQGAWVEGVDGRGWFAHFQQRGGHGRIIWLEPLAWKDDWPLMGTGVASGAETGEPVLSYALPASGGGEASPPSSDEFASSQLGPMWEWNHNPDNSRWSLSERSGFLRLHPGQAADLLHARNTLTFTMQSEFLETTADVDTRKLADEDRVGLSAFEKSLSGIGVHKAQGQQTLFFSSNGVDTPGPDIPEAQREHLLLRVHVAGDEATYSYSLNRGKTFKPLGTPVLLKLSWWKGARPAVFAFNTTGASTGFLDVDWVHTETLRK